MCALHDQYKDAFLTLVQYSRTTNTYCHWGHSNPSDFCIQKLINIKLLITFFVSVTLFIYNVHTDKISLCQNEQANVDFQSWSQLHPSLSICLHTRPTPLTFFISSAIFWMIVLGMTTSSMQDNHTEHRRWKFLCFHAPL